MTAGLTVMPVGLANLPRRTWQCLVLLFHPWVLLLVLAPRFYYLFLKLDLEFDLELDLEPGVET